MDKVIKDYFATIGRKGGQKSRRQLSPEKAKEMVLIREARKLYKKHHARCFWSYDPNYKVQAKDLRWVGESLLKYGGHELYQLGKKLCP